MYYDLLERFHSSSVLNRACRKNGRAFFILAFVLSFTPVCAYPRLSPFDFNRITTDASVILFGSVRKVEPTPATESKEGVADEGGFLIEVRVLHSLKGKASTEDVEVMVPGGFLPIIISSGKEPFALVWLKNVGDRLELFLEERRRWCSVILLNGFDSPDFNIVKNGGPIESIAHVIVSSTGSMQSESAMLILSELKAELLESVLKDALASDEPLRIAYIYRGLMFQGKRNYLEHFVDWYLQAEILEEEDRRIGGMVGTALESVVSHREIPVLRKAASSNKDRLVANWFTHGIGDRSVEWVPFLVELLSHRNEQLKYRSIIQLGAITGLNEHCPPWTIYVDDNAKYVRFWKEWWASGEGKRFLENPVYHGPGEIEVEAK